ncbi:LPS O-antigen length regulator [Paraneptunicella aestuarii]|uniref:Wzz/FepE/Etk N-terminal domain-containing protein n=1 Tax=Paraneptunicella aestuarii TaxID=2831148 RepID=UPI001E5BB4EF|nr:Wzz/FepE/Etk N-terminal domain-containing protein [Paraneptunicella aestuarii]UAA39643.1 LPS O-antigen length regulator [Paraneptunicella aestuarii]
MAQIGESVIDFKEIWRALWLGKWIIMGVAFVFAVASIVFTLSLPNQYQSQALLEPVSSTRSPLSGLSGNLGGLASLAGINLGAAGADDKSVRAIELMKTWDFLENFIKKNALEASVFAAIGWNKESNKLIYDPDLYDENSGKWVRDPAEAKSGQSEPSGWELFQAIKERIYVSKDDGTGLISLAVEHYSPYVAKQWVELLVKEINLYFQEVDRTEAKQRIVYLQEQIKETNVAEMRNIFFDIIQEQTQTLMLTEISDEYVLKTLSPAKIAEEKSKPSRAIIVIFVTFLGGIIGILVVLLRALFKEKK